MVKCKSQDKSLVESIIPDVVSTYTQVMGKDVSIKVDNENFLPADATGGIELTAQKGKIKVNNTLEARLELIAQQLIPEIRTALFGRNVNRKFTD